MMLTVVLLVCATCVLPGLSQSTPPYQTFYFNQSLDHFNPQETRTFSQRYLVYDDDWDPSKNGPIFFYAGNEGPIDAFYNNTGFMFDIAPQFGALIIFCEHRFYGETLPFGADSFTDANLAYLTVENAIADYAVFMTAMKGAYAAEASSVVVFGGSYGGILAAACRIHYPALFDMALAASAPVPQTLDTVNATTFFRLVTADFEAVDKRCPQIVREGFAHLLALAGADDYDALSSAFGTCSPLASPDDVTLLELWARNGLLTMAMADYPYSADFLGALPPWPVNVSCELMVEAYDGGGKDGAAAMGALAAGAGMYYNASEGDTLPCFNLSAEFIICADQTGCGLGSDATAWDYQMCTEIVYGIDTNNVTDMFPPRTWELANLTEYCRATYGVAPDPLWMQTWFPLDVANASTRIIWSNGLLDPWHGGGYLDSPKGSVDMPTVVIPHGAHHLDLRGKNSQDPEDVTEARQNETDIIEAWLEELQQERQDKEIKEEETRKGKENGNEL